MAGMAATEAAPWQVVRLRGFCALLIRGGRGPKRGPCAVVGCKDPSSSSGQWNWLPPDEELLGFPHPPRNLDSKSTTYASLSVPEPSKGSRQLGGEG